MKKSRGFTLVELLAVIAILGILLSVSTVAVFNIRKRQDEKNRQNLIINILTKAKEYVANHPEVLEVDNKATLEVSKLNVNFNKKQSSYLNLRVQIEKCIKEGGSVDEYKFKYTIIGAPDIEAPAQTKNYNDCGCEEQTGDAKEICEG